MLSNCFPKKDIIYIVKKSYNISISKQNIKFEIILLKTLQITNVRF